MLDATRLLEKYREEKLHSDMFRFSLSGGDPKEVPEFRKIINAREQVKKVKSYDISEEEYNQYSTLFNDILKERQKKK